MVRFVALLLGCCVQFQACAGTAEDQVPGVLAPWVPWALAGEDRRACPLPPGGGERLCVWPGRLHLDLDDAGGLFAQRWTVRDRAWVPLPGSPKHWPQGVRVGEVPAAVIERHGAPAVRLEPGEHALSGRFDWDQLPDGLALPVESALIALRLDGEVVAFPRIERDGMLWLGAGETRGRDEELETLTLEVYRRLEDDNPFRVITRLDLEVGGPAREVLLGPVPLADALPLRLSSPLPARLEPDGRLRLQVRPGRWVVEVVTQRPGPVAELPLPRLPTPWPGEEVWAFLAHPELRQVELSGAQLVDPRQTRLPQDWMQLPSYLMRPGETLRLDQIGRGDEEPASHQLSLRRELWMDFDGGGFSLRDRIEGKLAGARRLEVDAPLRLGRVEDGGAARFITRLAGTAREGVEVRPGQLSLVAEGRIEDMVRKLPAAGWALDFQGLEATLHLPPGWDLLAVTGVDNVPDTWLNRWTLLDLFLVLLLAVGAWRLWGIAWGLLTLTTMVLIWKETGAPSLVWLNLLAVIALRRVLPVTPEGTGMTRLRRAVSVYYRASLVVLAVIALPFLVDQARNALFPQLERPGIAPVRIADFETRRATEPAAAPALGRLRSKGALLGETMRPPEPEAPPRPVPRIDPNAKVQTGPGVPEWRWRDLDLKWHGPVPRDHGLELWLLSPGWNLLLAGVRIALILVLGLQFAGLVRSMLRRTTPVAGLLLAGGLMGFSGQGGAQGFPSPELLEELRSRLLEPPDCLRACADISRMELRTEGNSLRLTLEVAVEEASAVPIPGARGTWSPARMSLGGKPFDGLLSTPEGTYLAALPGGVWQLALSGPLPRRSRVEIPLPLRPRLVLVTGGGFRVEGIDEKGRPDAQIQLVRTEVEGAGPELRPVEVPPLVRVRRTLRLDVDWRVDTQVLRLSPARFPAVLEVPVIPGEQVLREDVRVRDGRVVVNLAPGQEKMDWSSSLEPADRIHLSAGDDPRLSEEWRVDVGPQWHLESEGIPTVHHQGRLADWLPNWRPWPGEEVKLVLSRPQGVPGPTLSLLRSDYRLVPGRRTAAASLALTLRSSQGGRHRIELPEGAELEAVTIDGSERPLRLEGRSLTLPLVPASQEAVVRWRQPDPMRVYYAPARPDVGLTGVNANLQMTLGSDRWVLYTGGPTLGPAVLFWGLVIVVSLLAIGLGRSRLTPLRTWDWLLLGLGLSQAGIGIGLLVIGWLFALGLRSRLDREMKAWRFNLMQTGLMLLSLAAFTALITAVQQGLLGMPEMQIAGNGSSATQLNWYQDRSGPELPEVRVISVPILVYRALMLAWALWLTLRLIGWLRWGWRALASPVLWREVNLRLPRTRVQTSRTGEGRS